MKANSELCKVSPFSFSLWSFFCFCPAMQLMSIKEKNVLSALPPKELVSVKVPFAQHLNPPTHLPTPCSHSARVGLRKRFVAASWRPTCPSTVRSKWHSRNGSKKEATPQNSRTTLQQTGSWRCTSYSNAVTLATLLSPGESQRSPFSSTSFN